MITDKQIFSDVTWKLEADSRIDSKKIVVGVKDGIVNLSGHVRRYSDKGYAEQDAKSVKGVLGVAEDIVVDFFGSKPPSDVEIAAAAIEELEWEVSFDDDPDVQIVVEDGFVTITGVVDYQYQKKRIYDLVRYLKGVTGVSNRLTLKKIPTPSNIKEEIKKSFLKNARMDAESIKIKIGDGGEVTLTGKVKSWSEHEEARNVAESIPGVTHVTNLIQLV